MRWSSRTVARLCLAALLGLGAPAALAQQTNPFSGLKHDTSLPIEIVSDSLEVRQTDQVAVFSGSVEARQGELRLSADQLEVFLDQAGSAAAGAAQPPGAGQIRLIRASGSVFLTSGAETAEGETAEYDVAAGTIRMTGSVVLTQGQNAIKGAALDIDLNTGLGRMEAGSGRVQSVFSPGSN